MVNYTPRTWVSGETVTAAEMNTEIRDFSVGVQGAWTADSRATSAIWTAASGTNTLSDGALVAFTRQMGKTIDWEVRITMGAGTSFSAGGWQFTPPLAPRANVMVNATCRAYDASLSSTLGWSLAVDLNSGLFSVKAPPTTQPNADRAVTSTVPFTWAVSDVLYLSTRYETT